MKDSHRPLCPGESPGEALLSILMKIWRRSDFTQPKLAILRNWSGSQDPTIGIWAEDGPENESHALITMLS